MSQIESIINQISNGKTTARKQVEIAIEKAKKHQDLNIFINLTEDRALSRADEVDEKIKAGKAVGKLAGVTFAVKDNFLTFGAPSTAASEILENFKTPFQAEAIERLEGEGAICIGKTNLDSFAHGSSTENSVLGVTNNSADKTRVAGGSSGGSAVAVALDIVSFALGTDTGGSIRQPASFNGVVGYKPTYGAVSRFGVIAAASSTDVVGPITKTAKDSELIMEVLAGQDHKDATSLPSFFEPQRSIKTPQKIGLIKEFMDSGLDDEVRAKALSYADKLKSAGHQVEEVSLPMARHSLAIYYIVVPAEISSNMARFDGVRYGKRVEAENLAELYGKSRSKGFVDETKRRIMIGSYVLSSGYFDAYYQQAQKARTLLIKEFNQLFENYDALLGPATPAPAFKIGENINDPVKMYLTDIMTVSSSLAGLPAVSLPAGVSKGGLPIGVQLIGYSSGDAKLLALAKLAEGGESE